MLENHYRWSMRCAFPGDGLPSLDFGTEIWNLNASHYENADEIRALLSSLGREHDDVTVAREAAEPTLRQVIHAAGGIEAAYSRWLEDIEGVRKTYSSWAKQTVMLDGTGMSDHSITRAWYTLADLCIWVRTLVERVDRKGWKTPERQGLLHALSPGPRQEAVRDATERLAGDRVLEACYLANFNLHQNPGHIGTPVALIADGRPVLIFPDPIVRPLRYRWELSFVRQRDAEECVDALWLDVSSFMDDLLCAFEENVPERFRDGR